jgi:apolipoprotein N-acyltransferase
VRKEANLLAIITNDGWWQNTPGYKQHALYAGLRAIETRCWVVRSANTGISGFIDPVGKWIEPQPYGTAACVTQKIPVGGGRTTFFVRYGDILSKAALMFCIGIWIWSWVYRRRKENS